MFCERCGTQLLDTAEFCTNCGNEFYNNYEKTKNNEILLEVRPTFKFIYNVFPKLLACLI